MTCKILSHKRNQPLLHPRLYSVNISERIHVNVDLYKWKGGLNYKDRQKVDEARKSTYVECFMALLLTCCFLNQLI